MAKGNEKQPNAGRQPPKVIRIVQDFAVSGLAASLSHIPHHPLYTLKSQMMFYGKGFSMKQFVTTSFESKGTFLMRGVKVRSIGIAPEKAFKIMGMQAGTHLANYLLPQCSKGFQLAFAGSVAGAATTIIGCPSERSMVLAQIEGKTFWEVVRTKGVRVLYHGAMATLYRDIIFNSCLFTGRGYRMKRYKDNGEEPSSFEKVWIGLPASVFAGVAACPFDVVKTRIQGTEKLGDAKSRRPLLLMRQLVREEGARSLFKGLLPRLIAVPLYMSVFITVSEDLGLRLLGREIIP